MPADSEMAALYAQRYTAAALAVYLDAALEAARESTTVSRAFEGSSMTISAETARQTALDLGEALRLRTASDDDGDSVLTASPWGTAIDFSSRPIE